MNMAKIYEVLRCIECKLAEVAARPATTSALARQTTGAVDYADASLLSVSVTCISGVVTLNGETVDAGASVGFESEAGALLSGAFSVDCGSSAGVALVSTTYRS